MQKWNKPWWSITKTATKVIEHLAYNPKIPPYQISKNLLIPTSSAYKATGELEERKLVSSKVDESWTRGQERKEYSLNINGFSHIVAFSKLRINEVCNKNRELIPLVTGKWSQFSNPEINEMAEKKLIETSINYLLDRKMPLPAPKDYGYSNTPEMFFSHVFYHPLYYNYKKDVMSNDEIEKWLTACSKDEEVKDYVTNLLEGIIEGYEESIILMKGLTKYLK